MTRVSLPVYQKTTSEWPTWRRGWGSRAHPDQDMSPSGSDHPRVEDLRNVGIKRGKPLKSMEVSVWSSGNINCQFSIIFQHAMIDYRRACLYIMFVMFVTFLAFALAPVVVLLLFSPFSVAMSGYVLIFGEIPRICQRSSSPSSPSYHIIIIINFPMVFTKLFFSVIDFGGHRLDGETVMSSHPTQRWLCFLRRGASTVRAGRCGWGTPWAKARLWKRETHPIRRPNLALEALDLDWCAVFILINHIYIIILFSILVH